MFHVKPEAIMARHSKDKTPEEWQETADNFDRQWQESYDRAEDKRQRHEYPYDLDLPERRVQ